eukprot:878925_1
MKNGETLRIPYNATDTSKHVTLYELRIGVLKLSQDNPSHAIFEHTLASVGPLIRNNCFVKRAPLQRAQSMMIHAGRLRLDGQAMVCIMEDMSQICAAAGAFTGFTATGVAKAKVLSKRFTHK